MDGGGGAGAEPVGIGRSAAIDQFSYAQVEVSKTQMTIDLLDSTTAAVLDTGDASSATPATPACGQIVIPRQ